MKKHLLLGIITSIFFMIIVVWQIRYLNEIRTVKRDFELAKLERQIKKALPIIRSDARLGKNMTVLKNINHESIEFQQYFISAVDSILKTTIGIDLAWAFWVKGGDDRLISNRDMLGLDAWRNSEIQECFSCYMLISFPDSEDDKKAVLSHKVSEMTKFGWEDDDLIYLSFIPESDVNYSFSDILVGVSVVSMSFLLALVLYINSKQKHLIIQKEEFLNHLSHQFKTPLASIRLGIQMLKSAPENTKMLELIDVESNRLDIHVQTVLQWIKSDATAFEVDLKFVNLNKVVNSVINQLEPLFVNQKIIHTIDFKVASAYIKADEYHLSLALFNLIENAISHNNVGIEIHLVVEIIEDEIQLSIKDNGQGFNVEEALSQKKNLGLYYVKNVMKAHKGSFIVNSEVGSYTEVILTFECVNHNC